MNSKTVGIRAKYIIAFDGEGHRILKEGVLVVQNDEIIFVGKKYSGHVDQWIDVENRMVTPGFINTHTHIDSSPMTKSFLEDFGNPQFYMSHLFDVLSPDLAYENEESVSTSVLLSAVEMLTSGTTTLIVMGTSIPDRVSEVLYKVGLRACVVPSIRSGTWQAEDGKAPIFRKHEKEGFDLLEKSVGFFSTCNKRYGGKITTMLGPDWIGGCTPELLKEVRRVAGQTGMRIQIHASESIIEVHEVLRKYGMTPIQFLESVGLLGNDLIVGHCIYVSGHGRTAYPGDGDLQLLAKYGASVAHCPWVFAKMGFIMESFAKYRKARINMSLGTDTCPQNMLLEMRYASILSKIFEKDPRATTAAHVFDAATLGGATALGRKDLGRICPGAKADLLFFRLDSPRMSPLRDPIRSIVYYADPTDIVDVMINGTMVMKDGFIAGMDVSKLSQTIQKCAEEMWDSISERDWAGRSADQVSKLSYPLWEA